MGFSEVNDINEVESEHSDFGDGDGVNEFDSTYDEINSGNGTLEYSEESEIEDSTVENNQSELEPAKDEVDSALEDFDDSKDVKTDEEVKEASRALSFAIRDLRTVYEENAGYGYPFY